jgi:hypothetical protein
MLESRRLNREMRGAWFWRLVERFVPAKRREEMLRMAGILLLERGE